MCLIKLIRKRKIEESRFSGAVKRHSKSDECLMCGRKITSPCNSHVVPQFVLKGIAENGYVSYGHALNKTNVGGIKKTTGINNAYTFRLLCERCEHKYFKHYENPDNILGFNLLTESEQKIILCEMALKTHLAHIAMKYERLIAMDIASCGRLSKAEKDGLVLADRLDINEHLHYKTKLKGAMKSNKNPFVILYDKLLDYGTKIATQTIINYNFDLNGNQIFDPDLLIKSNQCRYFYLMILPMKGKTRVMFYIEREYLNVANVLPIVKDFKALSDDEKLHFLFISLIIHDEQFYLTPSFGDMIFKKDKRLVRLYSSTDISGGKSTDCQMKIIKFREYANYLSKEYSA